MVNDRDYGIAKMADEIDVDAFKEIKEQIHSIFDGTDRCHKTTTTRIATKYAAILFDINTSWAATKYVRDSAHNSRHLVLQQQEIRWSYTNEIR